VRKETTSEIAERVGKSMQSGSGARAADAAAVGIQRRLRRMAVLLVGLAVSACAGTGQLANLTEGDRAAVAIQSVEGAPAAVVHRFVAMLEDEAAARQIPVVPLSEASYRLRAYLAAQGDGAASLTPVAWSVDVYRADGQRAVRLSGEEKAAGRPWQHADDETLRRVARASMERLAAFLGRSRPSAAAASAATPQPQGEASPAASPSPSALLSPLGSLDDWTPEAAGIFRILRGEPARTAATADAAAHATAAVPSNGIPLPRRQPAAADAAALAFAPEN
jgi:hypothetical protein